MQGHPAPVWFLPTQNDKIPSSSPPSGFSFSKIAIAAALTISTMLSSAQKFTAKKWPKKNHRRKFDFSYCVGMIIINLLYTKFFNNMTIWRWWPWAREKIIKLSRVSPSIFYKNFAQKLVYETFITKTRKRWAHVEKMMKIFHGYPRAYRSKITFLVRQHKK